MSREEVLEALSEIIEMENEEETINENTMIEDVIFDSITKLGLLAYMDNYAKTKRSVKDMLACEKISDLIDLVF